MATTDPYDLLQQELQPPQPLPPDQADPNTVAGRLEMGTRDVAQGFAQGLPGLLYNAAAWPINLGIKGIGALTGTDVSPYLVQPAATNVDRALNTAGLPQEGDVNAAGRIIRGAAAGLSSAPVGSILAGAPGLFGSVGTTLASQPIADVVGGAAGGASSLATDPLREKNPYLASFIDAATSLAAAGSTAGLSNLLNASGLPADVAAWAAKARDVYNIPLTAADISTTPAIRYAASVNRTLPFGGSAAADQDVRDALTTAISNTIGDNTSRITGAVMRGARDDMGKEFDRIGNVTTVTADNQLINDLAQIHYDAPLALSGSQAAPVQNTIDELQDLFAKNNGVVPGSVYQNLTKKSGPLSDLANNDDPSIANYGGKIENALFDAWERSAPPEEVQNLQDVRTQYKNLKTIEPLVEKSPTGQLNPLLLPGAVQRNWDDLAYTGAGALGDLADISSLFLRPPPDSGTAMRNFITGLIVHPTSIAGTLGGVAPANWGLGKALRSDWLTNRVIGNAGTPTVSVPPWLGAGVSTFPLGQNQQPTDPYSQLQSLLR